MMPQINGTKRKKFLLIIICLITSRVEFFNSCQAAVSLKINRHYSLQNKSRHDFIISGGSYSLCKSYPSFSNLKSRRLSFLKYSIIIIEPDFAGNTFKLLAFDFNSILSVVNLVPLKRIELKVSPL
jgi:hypothetical protein